MKCANFYLFDWEKKQTSQTFYMNDAITCAPYRASIDTVSLVSRDGEHATK